ncbi:sigma-70 family RNA polymerase sigma factor [Prevotella copri]|uniref:RNA polymerase sigma factor n=1 Tax=Segatella copri TaxID=165179 RepID=UPI00222FFD7B|nr:sigma-70 family RNA polymerase sigma factor [Segatella copri]MCW4105856.1 sigma-70 family RNA polymerase sigma factor [Segatella copri]
MPNPHTFTGDPNNIREREEAAQTLLAAYRQGDQNAFMSLYDMYAEMLLNYGLCITSDKELVKDCVQDVFIKLISKSQDLQVTKVTSYLLISLRNRLLDEFRRKNYMTETAVEDIRISTTVEDVENSYILDESSFNNVRKVQILMDELTPRQRQVFTLYYIEQRKYEDICDIMQMNYHSVRNLVHRGMLKLRAAVAV